MQEAVSRKREADPADAPGQPPRPGMLWIPGGTFAMGSEDFYPEERPVHHVSVDGFWMDDTPVTAAPFRRFVGETKHVTQQGQAIDSSTTHLGFRCIARSDRP